MATDAKKGMERLEEEMNELLLAASDEEILEDARAAGDDTAAFAARMRESIERAKVEAGQRRLQQARAEIEKRKSEAGRVIPMRRPTDRPRGYVPDTLAARHGKDGLSEKDRQGFEEDMDELYDDDAWNTSDKDD